MYALSLLALVVVVLVCLVLPGAYGSAERDRAHRRRYVARHPREANRGDIAAALVEVGVPVMEAECLLDRAHTTGLTTALQWRWLGHFGAGSLRLAIAAELGPHQMEERLASGTTGEAELELFAALNGFSPLPLAEEPAQTQRAS